MGPQSCGSPKLGVLGQNAIWMWALRRGIEYTIRGEVVASPKFGPWWVLWVRVYLWLVLAPKCSNYALTNFLFDLCRSVRVIKCLLFFLVSSRSSSTPLYPQSATSQGACPNSLLFCCFHFILTFESIKELGSASWCVECIFYLGGIVYQLCFCGGERLFYFEWIFSYCFWALFYYN